MGNSAPGTALERNTSEKSRKPSLMPGLLKAHVVLDDLRIFKCTQIGRPWFTCSGTNYIVFCLYHLVGEHVPTHFCPALGFAFPELMAKWEGEGWWHGVGGVAWRGLLGDFARQEARTNWGGMPKFGFCRKSAREGRRASVSGMPLHPVVQMSLWLFHILRGMLNLNSNEGVWKTAGCVDVTCDSSSMRNQWLTAPGFLQFYCHLNRLPH